MDPLVINTVLWIGGIGLVCGLALAVAAKYLGVHEDPRIEQVTQMLPGVNCGGCGLAGCASYAAALVEGKAAANL
ncbi:MAG: (Fe-S)-binding protein, partial [Kiritimatiellae bacterium]|nr:(Fe-S)-binding protein [Kiritimatiellia bacterium]